MYGTMDLHICHIPKVIRNYLAALFKSHPFISAQADFLVRKIDSHFVTRKN